VTRLLTEARLDEIRANHRAVDTSEHAWDGADDPLTAVKAFEDRADLLDEVDMWRGLFAALTEAVAEKRIEAMNAAPRRHGRFDAFTEVLRIIAPRVTPDDFATVAEIVKAVGKGPGP
jgi:hypothetical protein